MIQPSSPSLYLYPCQLRCHGCGMIHNMPPSTLSHSSFCPNCHVHQTLLAPPRSNTSRGVPVTVRVHGIDPFKMQVVCANFNCKAILNIPPHALNYSSTHFKCPLCLLHLPCYIFPVAPTSTAASVLAQTPEKVLESTDDNSDMKDATPSVSASEEEPLRSIFLLKDKKRVREFDKVEDCFLLDFDSHRLSSDSKSIDDRIEDSDLDDVQQD